MKIYNVDQAFEILKANKITTNKESIRRWLRQGVIKGIAPTSKKKGWTIPEENLNDFIKSRLPDSYINTNEQEVDENNKTFVVNDDLKESIRSEMWKELARKNIFEGYIDVKKTMIKQCIAHRKYSKDLEEKVWEACEDNSKAYNKPRISYLLDAFAFGGKRILMDKNFESLEEQIIFPVIEYVKEKSK